MKKLLLFALIPFTSWAAVEYDLKKGIDLTGAVTINASQLNQLVDAGTLATNKGAIIRQSATPDTALNPRYTNFLWLDISAGLPGVLKVWSGAAWATNIFGSGQVVTTNIADGSITSAKLANGAVTTAKVNDNAITDVKLSAGAVVSSKISSGAISNIHIANSTIEGTKLANNSILTANISDSNVTSNKLASDSVTSIKIAAGAVTSTKIADSAVVAGKLTTGSVSMTNIVSAITNLLPKAFVSFTASSSPAIIGTAHNVTSVARDSQGLFTLTFTSALASTNYTVSTSLNIAATNATSYYRNAAVGSFKVEIKDETGTSIDIGLPMSAIVYLNQ